MYYNGELFWQGRKYLGDGKTNNEAEYEGLLHGLQACRELTAKEIKVFGDSKLVAKQIMKEWKISKPHIQRFVDQAYELLARFSSFTIEHVLREDNKEADRLANEAMDSRSSKQNYVGSAHWPILTPPRKEVADHVVGGDDELIATESYHSDISD